MKKKKLNCEQHVDDGDNIPAGIADHTLCTVYVYKQLKAPVFQPHRTAITKSYDRKLIRELALMTKQINFHYCFIKHEDAAATRRNSRAEDCQMPSP